MGSEGAVVHVYHNLLYFTLIHTPNQSRIVVVLDETGHNVLSNKENEAASTHFVK